MSDLRQRRVRTNGIWMNIAEKGRGPLVLLLHGFPQLWFSWNYQITQLAKHGYRVVAPDMRGYGDTDAPPDPASYTVIHLVGDIIGLLDELGEEREPGRAEKAFSRYDCLTVMKKFLLIDAPDHETAPPGVEFIDFLDTPISLPPWITEEELIFSASKFRKSGFTGPLNYFRAMDLNWEFLKPWQGAKITVPAKLIIGDKDVWFHTFGTKEYMEKGAYKNFVPNLEVVFIDGHRHIQQEKAEEVTHEILSFFNDPSLM
ncbi:PREDICTED: bifunctional epoxide hydrolase 2-like isoform X2 [Nelumbo nucifera]|uniref:Bifunctional epoxide hydrolase 2-like isoform X2 n=1 Tax=Nelumbo nucifera TaxID=4432 RepID=A0A1U7ZKW1_NELNU|nr:PREDICTED: bifunctional epoxide hydrolase 2-like isoform X2 [Nelumbo nucifera]